MPILILLTSIDNSTTMYLYIYCSSKPLSKLCCTVADYIIL